MWMWMESEVESSLNSCSVLYMCVKCVGYVGLLGFWM